MKRTCALLTAFTLINCIAGSGSWQSASAAEPLFSTYLEAGTKAIHNNNQEAIRMLEMALKNSEHLKEDDPKLLDLYDSLGDTLAKAGNEKKAEEYLVKALKLRSASQTKDELLLFRSMIYLGTLYRDQNRFTESEELYKKAMATYTKTGPLAAVFQATALTALGTMYVQMSRPVEAEMLLRKALEMRKTASQIVGPSDAIYDALGRALESQDKFAEAEKVLTEAVAISEKESSPETHALSQINLAVVYSDLGKYKEARELINKATKTIEAKRGLRSPSTATCYSNLASVAIDQDQYGEAEALLNKALSIHEEALGKDNASVAYDLLKLMAIYRNQGQYTKAQETGERSIAIFKKTLGVDSIATAKAMSRLADLYVNQLRFDDADKLAQEVIRVLADKLGSESVEYAIGLLLAAEVSYGKHNIPDAIVNMQKAADILSNNQNAEPGLRARVNEELAEYLQQEGKHKDAADRLNKSIEIREKSLGKDNLRILPSLKALAEIYDSMKNDVASAEVRKRIAQLQDSNPAAPNSLFERSPHILAAETTLLNNNLPPRPVRDKWALAIGISNFANPALNLKYAAKDAVDFSNYLVHNENFAPDHVKVLTDKNATRQSIIDALGKAGLGKQVQPEDLVVVYISSHGSMAKTEAGGTNFLVAYDTQEDGLLSTGIPMQWLSEIIKEQIHSNRVVLVMDVCHSGAVSEERSLTLKGADTAAPNKTDLNTTGSAAITVASVPELKVPAGAKGLGRLRDFDVNKLESGSGQAIICSSSPDQVSWESKQYPNSVFTRRLIESMQKQKPNANLTLIFENLQKDVEDEVLRDRGQVQTPILSNKNWQGPPPILSVQPVAPLASAPSAKAEK